VETVRVLLIKPVLGRGVYDGDFSAEEVFYFACLDGVGTLVRNQLVQVYALDGYGGGVTLYAHGGW
jgi:hypothetical protein